MPILKNDAFGESLPMRGVWIEIRINISAVRTRRVTPHAGSVD